MQARDHRFEDLPEQIALAEAPMPVLGKTGMVRHGVIQVEVTKPSIGQVERHLLAQPRD